MPTRPRTRARSSSRTPPPGVPLDRAAIENEPPAELPEATVNVTKHAAPTMMESLVREADEPRRSMDDPRRTATEPPTRSADEAEGSRETRIAEGAWLRAEARGFAPGHELEDWLAAEREVDGGAH